MKELERQHFLTSYERLLTSTWSSHRFADRLRRDPLAALASCGLAVPAGSRAEILDDPGPARLLTDPDIAVSQWENGHTTGTFVLHVPTTPHPGRGPNAMAGRLGRGPADQLSTGHAGPA